jgi:hypothetical protein
MARGLRPVGMSRWKPSLATILLAVTLAACGSQAPSGNAPVRAAAFGSPACPTADKPGPDRGAVPDGFVTAWVLRCSSTFFNLRDGETIPPVGERADTPADELVAALRKPSDPPSQGHCTAELINPPYLMLVDASGRAVAPAIPIDGCGKPRRDVLAALEKLPFRRI